MPNSIHYRSLTKNDLNAFFNLRLEALQHAPTSFCSSYEEEKSAGTQLFENILNHDDSSNVIFGAFIDKQLIGTMGIFQDTRLKGKHKCTIWGVYVDAAYRQHGVAKSLLNEVIAHAKNATGCILINLIVETTNVAAKRLYESYGFEVWGSEPNAMQVDGKFYDHYHMALSLED